MKKLIATLSAAVIGTVSLFCTACGDPEYSETFTGSLSEETYSDKHTALKEFFTNEVGLTLASYHNTDRFGAKELKERFPEIDAANVKTVDEYTVYNFENYEGCSHPVYIIEYNASSEEEGAYRYLTPPSPVGSHASFSYCKDVFAAEKYANCTLKMSDETIGQFEWDYSKYEYTVKVTENYVSYIRTYAAEREDEKRNETYEEFYLKQENGVWRCFSRLEQNFLSLIYGEWMPDQVVYGWEEWGDASEDFGEQSVFLKVLPSQALYGKDSFNRTVFYQNTFLKTETGFKPENPNKGCPEGATATEEFFVKEGAITKYERTFSYPDRPANSIYSKSYTIAAEWSDFGKTEIEVPEGVRILL